MGLESRPDLRRRRPRITVAVLAIALLVPAAGIRAEERGSRLVYSCRSAGSVTVSDRPCGEDSVVHRLEPGPAAAPPDGRAPNTAAPAPRAAVLPRVERRPPTPGLRDGGTSCEALRRRLESIDEQMRRGYRAREAAALWTRWRDARAALRAADC